MINFDTILRDCQSRYRPFEGTIKRERKPRSFEKAIQRADGNAIIAEIKPSSPSGKNRVVDDPRGITLEILEGGACGLSVLTESKYFGGSLSNLADVAKVSSVPVLRKDFIFDEAQIAESYHYGGDSLLLIASFFSRARLSEFLDGSRDLGMEPLVEVHSLDDIAKARDAGAMLYVINNRDKDTLKVDLRRSEEFSAHIDGLKISASGISTKDDLEYVLGYCDAALIGSSLMRSDNIREKTRGFVYGTR